MADDYGFQSPNTRQGRRDTGDSPKATSGSPTQSQIAHMDWWLAEVNRRVKAYMGKPEADQKALLDAVLENYAAAVLNKQVRPPRFSTD